MQNTGSQIVEQPGGTASIEIDRVNMPTQQLATTLRVPLGKPVLVGGLTLDPAGGTADDEPQQERKQMYLVVQTSVGD